MSYKPTLCDDTKEYAETYEEYLSTRHWRALRIKIARSKKYKCELCEKKIEVGYHIHHKTYKRLGKERLSDLMFLCEKCHKDLHISLKEENYNHKNAKIERKTCKNCLYSKIIVRNNKCNTKVLWCDMKCFEPKDNLCSFYKRGIEKSIIDTKTKKKKFNKKKQKGVKK